MTSAPLSARIIPVKAATVLPAPHSTTIRPSHIVRGTYRSSPISHPPSRTADHQGRVLTPESEGVDLHRPRA